MTVHRTSEPCPCCAKPIDLGDGLLSTSTRPAPSAGDVTVCPSCFELLSFSDQGAVLPMTREMLDALTPRVRSALHGARELLLEVLGAERRRGRAKSKARKSR